MTPTQHSSSVAEIDPVVLYEILRLRVDVFVVEQECPYPELDGRDLEPSARLLWSTDDDARVLATLRVLHDGDDRRIGRVATASSARGRGLAADLMRSAVDECDGRLVRLDAQAHLSGWYARFGFVVDGDEFLEDGIPHLPMTLAARR
ncbi:GNAT family N-acetyltransferase [Frigoribacterium sp. SL97]|uniref:GNAT family N-acetyltransferase n=1 Tax=Frigoribacterium sp. SL97 TaxID=2994664 RepID=UPI00226F1F79|nr:GNAT family N-acetyltransferase [Frigoribacterium sp. SL97]WAC51195.1 GNAT family N-acetyltransferase [Frigoribacterium sp. SL97]